jgi:hypothetical protein
MCKVRKRASHYDCRRLDCKLFCVCVTMGIRHTYRATNASDHTSSALRFLPDLITVLSALLISRRKGTRTSKNRRRSAT